MVETDTELTQPREFCPNCDSERLKLSYEDQRFLYGALGSEVELRATVPVFTCEKCGYQFTDDRAEELRQEAVCRHIGVQSPREITNIREALGLNQAQFADLTGIGTASLSRWENGALIQNASNDRLLYLMRFRDNAERLRDRARQVSISAEEEHAAPVEHLAPEATVRACRIRPRALRDVRRVQVVAVNWRLRVPY